MGRLTQLSILASLSLVAGVAVGQQGLIVEPWRKAPAPAAALAVVEPMPASGLPPASPVSRKPQPPVAELVAPVRHKWSPPIVELLVDPWVRLPVARAAAQPAQSNWVPRRLEIIDPWAGSAPMRGPVAPTRPSGNVPSTIF